jgi:hypothetical protein
MAKRSTKNGAQELLTLACKLAETPGLTWVEANNAIFGPGGPFARLFPTKSGRAAFAGTKERGQIDALIESLPDPPVGPQRRKYSGSSTCAFPNHYTPPSPASPRPKE